MTCKRMARALLSRAIGAIGAVGALLLLSSWTLVPACTVHQEGTLLEVLVTDNPGGSGESGESGVREVQTDLGYRVTLQHAYLVLARVELVPCEQAALEPHSWWRDAAAWLAPQRALAHGTSTPTVWAVPYVLDLLDARDRDLSVTRMRPPAKHYCAARFLLDTADFDAENQPSDVNMVGLTIHLDGRFTAPGQSGVHGFNYETSVLMPSVLPFVDEDGAPAVLALSEGQLTGEVRFELGIAGMLDGLQLVGGDYEPHALVVLDNVLADARAVVTGAAARSRPAGSAQSTTSQ